MFHVEHQIIYEELLARKAQLVREVFAQNQEFFDNYIDNLLWWNKKVNLMSRDVSRETISLHVEHSLVLIASGMFRKSDKIIDVGSGGGLPGIPLAIAFPGKEFVLNDIVKKKMLVCKSISSEMSLKNVSTVADSVEFVDMQENDLLVSKHAFKINGLFNLIREKSWRRIVFLKGRNEVENELLGIEEKLKVSVYNLFPAFGDEFYKGKAMVEIERDVNE